MVTLQNFGLLYNRDTEERMLTPQRLELPVEAAGLMLGLEERVGILT